MKRRLYIFIISTLLAASATGQVQHLHGQVVNIESVEPLSDVEIQVFSRGNLISRTLTDDFGEFKVSLSPDTYQINIDQLGFISTQISNIIIWENSSVNLEIELSKCSGFCCFPNLIEYKNSLYAPENLATYTNYSSSQINWMY